MGPWYVNSIDQVLDITALGYRYDTTHSKIPTVSEWGLVFMTLLSFTVGAVLYRRLPAVTT